jgi:hypothetical protein
LPPGDWDRENMIGISHILKLKQKKRERIQVLERMQKEKEEEDKALLMPAKEKEIEKKEFAKKEEATLVETSFDPLVWTRQPFGGVINEFKQRSPLFLSDITDAFNPMCMAAIVFIFCSALSGAIAFGGLLGYLFALKFSYITISIPYSAYCLTRKYILFYSLIF